MAQSIRCPHCGKTYVLKPELAGKQVRCRQCQKTFTVTAPRPPDDLEEPILLAAAPAAAPSPTSALFDLLDQGLAEGRKIEPPGQGAPASGRPASPPGQTILPPVAARRQAAAGNLVFQRLLERKLSAAVAVVSLGLMVVIILLIFGAGLRWYFVGLPMIGMGLAALGLWLPVQKRRGRRGLVLDAAAARIAVGCGVIGTILGVLFGILYLAGRSGHPIPPALGL